MAPKYPRWRTLQHIRQQAGPQDYLPPNSSEGTGLFSVAGFAASGVSGQPVVQNTSSSPLGPNPTEFTSYFAPTLPAGEYLATVTQSVTDPNSGDVVNLISRQPFHIHGPRFSLQPDIVHQVYPPTGTSEHNNVLPHIVLEDPHLPWEQAIVPREAEDHTPNRVPWLALLVFVESELKLDPKIAKSGKEDPSIANPDPKGGLLPNPRKGMPDETVQQDSVTFAVKTTVGDVIDLASRTLERPFQFPLTGDDVSETDDLSQPIDLIYVQQQQVDNLFSSSGPDGSKIEVQPNQTPDMSRYAYLSHVRKNASAEHSAENDEHCSVVIAHQTGPIKDPEPRPLIVHLVSLEGVNRNIKLKPTADADHNGLVGLISLYSWTFTSLPPDKVNLIASLKKIGADLQDSPDSKGDCWLRAPRAKIDALRSNKKAPALSEKLAQRLEDGFMLQRYLPQTGEETISFFRGPLTPTYVKPITEDWWPMQSNFSTDYQVLDPNLGVMDVSYSAAWQLGKVLGLSNQQFAAALVRLRSSISIDANTTADSEYNGTNTNTTQILSSLAGGVSQMNKLAQDPNVKLERVGGKRGTIIGSYKPGVDMHPTTDFTTPRQDYEAREQVAKDRKREMYIAHLRDNVDKVSATIDSQTGDLHMADDAQYLPYNEVNIPASTDWQIVLQFVLRKMNLYDIPAHYLITDASNLPKESLKYFYIDSNWMDALLDGMLSIGNHLEQKDDIIKQAMKKNLNSYFATPYGLSDGDYRPQVPCFGFFLRSAIVKAFPGLEVSAPFPDASQKRQQAILVERIEEDVLFCLFDRMPGSPHWHPNDGISISSPPHQPCFRLGNSLTCDDAAGGKLVLQLRPLYTTQDKLPYEEEQRAVSAAEPEYRWRSLDQITYTTVNGVDGHDAAGVLPTRVFDFDNRMLVLPAYGKMCLDFLDKEVNKDRAKKYFQDKVPTAVLVGLQLNSSIPALVISTPSVPSSSHPLDTIDNVRQIRLPGVSSSSVVSNALVAPPLNVETRSQQSPSPADLQLETNSAQKASQNTRSNTAVADDDGSIPETGSKFLDALAAKIEYHLRQRREADGLSRPYLTPPKLMRSNYFTKLVGWIEDVVTEVEGGEVPIGGYIPAQYTTEVRMDGEDDLGKASDGNFPPVDLIFSIKFRDFTDKTEKLSDKLWDKPDLQLFNLQVDIPLGAGASGISEVYNGSGAKMLNNQLFAIHLEDVTTERRDEGHFVRFTLVPRTILRSIPLSKCADMSLIVNQIVPNVKKGRCSFYITENYRSRWVKAGAGREAAPAPPTRAIEVHASQLWWREHQAAHSTNLRWGEGWSDFVNDFFGQLIGSMVLLSTATTILALATVGVPLLFVVVKVLMIVVPLVVRAVVWTALHLAWTACWIWGALPYVLGTITVVSAIAGVVLFKKAKTPSEVVIIWVVTMQVVSTLVPAIIIYLGTNVSMKLLSFVLPLVPIPVIWILSHWPYIIVIALSAFAFWIFGTESDGVAKIFALFVVWFQGLPVMIMSLGLWVAVRLLMFIWRTVLPAVWDDVSPVLHWFSVHRVPILMTTIAAYLTVWYRTSDRSVFYTMAFFALVVVMATLSGTLIAWVWRLLFGT